MRHSAAAVLGIGAVVAIGAFVARGPLQFDGTDFAGGVYPAARAVLSGADPYDATELRRVFDVSCPETPFNAQGYPPWYVLSALWLGLLPVDAAGRLWLLANVAMALAVAALVGPRRSMALRLGAAAVVLAYLPTVGLLRVGQYTMPVVLGAALLVRWARSGSAIAGAAGIALLAFKPHVGIFPALAAAPALWSRDRRALWGAVALGMVLAAGAFLVSRTWPVTYPSSALALLGDPRNVACDTCASLVGILARRAPGTLPALPLAVATAAVVALVTRGRPPDVRVAAGALAASLALPLFRNYDFPLLLVPMFVAAERTTRAGLVALAIAWTLPVIGLFTDRAASVHPLWVSALLVLAVLVGSRQAEPAPAVAPPASPRLTR